MQRILRRLLALLIACGMSIKRPRELDLRLPRWERPIVAGLMEAKPATRFGERFQRFQTRL